MRQRGSWVLLIAPLSSRRLGSVTPAPHSWQVNAIVREKPGNRFTWPHFGHISLQTLSVSSISSNVRCRSDRGTVWTTWPHSLQNYIRVNATKDSIQAAAAIMVAKFRMR